MIGWLQWVLKPHGNAKVCSMQEYVTEANRKNTFTKKKPHTLFYVRKNIRENKKERFALHLVTAWRAAFESAIQFHLEMQVPYSFLSLSFFLSLRWEHVRFANGPHTRHYIRCVWLHCFFYDTHYAVYAWAALHHVLNNAEGSTLYKTVMREQPTSLCSLLH